MNHIDISVGDTIVTSGYGTIFPKDINIGVVSKIKIEITLDIKIGS